MDERDKKKKILEAGLRFKQSEKTQKRLSSESVDTPEARQIRAAEVSESRRQNGGKTFIDSSVQTPTFRTAWDNSVGARQRKEAERTAERRANAPVESKMTWGALSSYYKGMEEFKKMPGVGDALSDGSQKHMNNRINEQILENAKQDTADLSAFDRMKEFAGDENAAKEYADAQQKRRKQIKGEYYYLNDDVMADIEIMATGINAESLNTGIMGLANKGTATGKALAQQTANGKAARERLLAKGYSEAQVDKWAKMRADEQNAEFQQETWDDLEQFSEDHPVAASIYSTAYKFATLPVDAALMAEGVINDDIDTTSAVSTALQADEMMRSAVSEDIAEDYGDAWAFVYNTGMSAVDSTAAAFMPGGAYILATDAATSTMRDLTNRGLSTEEALAGGLVAGVAEGFFESVSIGRFKKLQTQTPIGVKGFVVNYFKEAGVNLTEEAATELTNIVYDTVANGENSNRELMIAELMQENPEMTREEAEKQANLKLINQVVEAGLSGALMGGGMSVVHSGIGYSANYKPTKAVGQAVKSDGVADIVLGQGALASKKSRAGQAYQHAQKKLDKGKSLSNRDIGLVATESARYMQENAPELNGVFESAKTVKDVEALYNTERYRIQNSPLTTQETKSAIKALDADYKAAKNSIENFDASGARAMSDFARNSMSETDTVKTRKPTIGKTDGGEVISVSAIENIKDGNITVKTSEGTTQEININKDIKSVDAQTLWTNATQNFPDAASAQAFIDNYDGGSIADYTKAFKDYYHLAATGMSLNDINKHEIAPYYNLSEQAQVAAVELGQKAISYQQGVVDLTARPKTKAQQLQVSMLDSIGKHIGMNVVVVDNMSKYEGFYRSGTNQIVIALDSSRGAILRTAGHETYHFVKEKMSDKAKKIENFVLDTLTKNKGEKWVNDRLKFYEKQGYKTKEAQIDELVADSLFDVFTNKRAVKDFATENQSLANKLVSHIQKLVADIKNIINKLVATGKYNEIKAWQDDLESLDKLNNMFLDVLDELAAKNTDAPTETKNTAEAVKSTRRDVITKSDISAAQSIGRKSINSLSPAELNSLSAFAKKYWNELGAKSPFFRAWFGDWREGDITPVVVANKKDSSKGLVTNHDTGWDINVSRIFFNETFNHKKAQNINARPYAQYIRDIIEKSVLLESHGIDPKKSDNSLLMHTFYAVADIGNGQEILKLYVEEMFDPNSDNTNKRAYQLQTIERQQSGVTGSGKTLAVSNQTVAIKTVADLFSLVKQNDKNFTPNPASKIVNPDGTPKVMYHGTQSSFTAFDKKKAKSSGYYGKGFYFTESESHSKQYGNSMAVYLDVKNPLEPGKNKLTKNQLRAFLEVVAENEDYDIWNYGTEDISEIIDSIYKNDAFAVIQDINATAIGNFAEALELFNEINGTNYDGIVTPTETVVYEPTQIKSVDNIGMFDKSNDDIYFSTKRNVEETKKNQLDIINETNPAPNSYNTWIRTVDDIKTLPETLEDSEWDYEEFIPDLTRTDIRNAIESGKITVYSSHPISNGVFVSPSRMEAKSYSGNGKVYEKTVDINDVAWIDPTQGQYAKVAEQQDDIKYATKRPWHTGMQAAEVIRIERIAKNELFKTDNYLDNITKWLYNDRNGTPYFALYSTEDESSPTILYASKGNNAVAERTFILDCLKELEAILDDGKTEALNKILEDLKNTDNLRAVYSIVPSNGRVGNGNVSLHSGQFGSGVSGALRICLQDCIERRTSGGVKKYSLKRESSISEDASNYILDTKEYREVMSIIDQRFELAGNKTLSPKAIDRYAGRLLEKSKSNYSREQLTERLTALFDFIANSRDVSWEEVTEIAANISKDMLKESRTLDRSMQTEYADVLKLMKETKVYISPEVKAEIAYNFGSYDSFRRLLGNKLKVTVTDTSAVPLDVFWRELSENRPEMFDEDTNVLDMPSRLSEFFEMTSPQYTNPYDNIEMDMDEAAYDFALQMYDEYFNIPEVKTEAQKYALKEERLRGKYNAKIKEIHNTYRERMKHIRNEHLDKMNELRKTDRERYEQLRDNKNRKIQETKELYRQRHESYRNKRNETQAKQKLRSQIYRTAKGLVDKLVNPTDQKHIPQELISSVNEFAKAITESGVFTPDKAKRLKRAFKAISENGIDADANLSTMYNEEFAEMFESLQDTVAGRRLTELNSSELETVRDTIKYVSHVVSMSNRAFSDGIKERLSVLQNDTLDEFSKLKPDRKRVKFEIQKGLLKPVTFFELLESPTMMKLYENIRQGEGKWYNTITAAKLRRQEAAKQYNYKSWKNDTVKIRPERLDGEIVLSVEEALSIYATANREQGVEHICLGGIVREEDAKKKLKSKDKAKSVDVRSENIPLTVNDMVEITSQLTKEQKAYADNLIEFMSKDMAALGNEVSMRLFGIKKFNEKKYFPLKSASNFLFSKPAVENDARIKHMSMTKPTTPKANNPVIIGNFTETVMSHCNDMALYNAFCLPLEDFNRVYNFKTQPTTFERPTSIKQKIDTTYGTKANSYIKQLLTDINGGVTQQAGAGFVNKMIAKAKKNAVFGSLSVAVQQPSAVARAFLYVDPKYFVSSTFNKRDWDELKKYAPVAGVKEMGYFDTNVGKQAVDWMSEDGYDGLKEKAFALFKDKDYRDDKLSFLPSYMDRITWGHIWNAVKKETAHNNPDMDKKSDEFLKLAGERFTYVIDRTQVYDSVFARSEWMRSKDTGVKVATAFMSEPLTNYNMLYSAAIKVRHGDVKFGAKALSVYLVSVSFNSMLKALVTAGRDDDEDKSYWEKYLSHVVGGFVDEPLGMIPYLKDFVSLLQGYDSKRMDTQALADIADAAMTMFKDNKSGQEKIKSVLGAAGVWLGIPFKNLVRDGEMIYRGVKDIFDGKKQSTTQKGIEYAIKGELGLGTPSQGEQFVEAYFSDDTKHYDKVYENLNRKYGGDKEKLASQISNTLHTMYDDGKITAEKAEKALVKLAGKDETDAFWTVTEWAESVKGEEYSRYDSFIEAVESGNRADIQTEIDRHLENGHSEDSLQSALTKHYKERYMSIGPSDKRELKELEKDMIKGYGYLDKEKDSNDIYWTFREWGSDDENYAKYNDFAEAVRTGKNLNSVFDEYLDHGVEKKTLAGQITKTFKQEYIELYRTDRAEASALRRRLLDAYVALGYDRDDKADDIAAWLEQ